MPKLVVLEDDVLLKLLRNPLAVAAFPFMRAAAERVKPKKKRGCVPCGAKNRLNSLDLAGVKAAIASMPLDKKAELKQLLSADEIRLYYTNVKRQKVRVTF